ncbi:hypothetical protein [Propionivibrio sp.]|uniref:hypothetical protein n=1 Tax=Propionivibrio sp. TaxID=2212460 RepID=UPI003BF1E856
MKTTIPTPEFKINKRIVCPIEIDMYNIKGKYQDGNWHALILATAQKWVEKKQFEGKGTIWSRVQPSANFENFTNTCFITAFGMAGFIDQLEINLCAYFSRQVRRSDEMQIEQGNWRPYLHLEQGKIWIVEDEDVWQELGLHQPNH